MSWMLLSCVALAACGAKRGDSESVTTPEVGPAAGTASTAAPGDDGDDDDDGDDGDATYRTMTSAPTPAPTPTRSLQNVVVVSDPAALAPIEAAGGHIGNLLAGVAVSDNRALAESPRYAAVVEVLERDVRGLERADPEAGVGIRGNSHRLFDRRWLTSPEARYELIGVVYRVDRIPTRTDVRCGDVHMIYRLAYTTQVSGESVSSRLPMTLVVFLPGLGMDMDKGDDIDIDIDKAAGKAGSCARAAAAWRVPADVQGRALGEWLVSDHGPLGLGALAMAKVERVRVNMQSARWPSAVRPDLGGHAEYILRSFVPDGARLVPRLLENTPDVDKLRKNKALRAQLRQWIADNLASIDDGTAMIPDKFLDMRSDSVTPRGLSRRANRPFRQIFAPDEFADLGYAERVYAASPEALLRRLDDMTCAGCHQSRTIAGFHLLGQDAPDVAPGNAIALYMSTHLHDEIARRGRILEGLAENRPVSYARGFAERGPHDRGLSGSRCGLGDPAFASWTCAQGLVCDPYDAPADDRAVGTCLPPGQMAVGDPCEFGELEAHRDGHRDRTRNQVKRSCADDAVCNINRVGFPGGMCTASCQDLPEGGACGVIALLTPFNNCLARKTPFPRCLAEHVAPAGLRACDRDNPCRDDYICSRTPSGEGACIPPYFLFQMRVDGHP